MTKVAQGTKKSLSCERNRGYEQGVYILLLVGAGTDESDPGCQSRRRLFLGCRWQTLFGFCFPIGQYQCRASESESGEGHPRSSRTINFCRAGDGHRAARSAWQKISGDHAR